MLVLLITAAKLSHAAEPAKPVPDPAFDVMEFRVEGNTVLSALDIERAVYPHLGEGKHFSDVEAARKALEDLYQSRGYQTVFVEIPEQKVEGGVIRLRVLEGKVERTRVTGSRYFELGEIRTRAAELAPGSVPEFSEVQKELAQLNRTPDRQVSPILSPGRTPGTVDVQLSVKDELPLHGDLETDNYSSPYTARQRANASLHYDNLWQRQHSVAISYQVAPTAFADSSVWSGTYLWRFAEADDVVSLYAIHSSSNVAVLGSSTILGKATIYGARWIRPIGSGGWGAANYFNTLTFGWDRKDFDQTDISTLTGNANILPPISYSPVSVTLSSSQLWTSGNVQFSLGLASAPRGLFGNSDTAFRGRRVTAESGYLAWKSNVTGEQWVGRHFSGFGRIDGQWTADPLIPNEQYSAGGFETVRGYKESEVIGDRGVSGTVEFRWHPLGRLALDGTRSFYAMTFIDGADVRLIDPQGLQVHGNTLASAGLGLRAQGWHGLHISLDVERILLEGGRGSKGAITPKGVERFDFSVGQSF